MKIHPINTTGSTRLWQTRALWIGILAVLGVVAITPVIGEGMFQRTSSPQLPPAILRTPDANDQTQINQQYAKAQNFEAANAARKKQIADDSTKLLKLATDLKAEVDKTNKDTLSLNVIRKAGEIEKLAHDVKEKMKIAVGQG